MLCWGSWANTLKLEPRSNRFPFLYCDQAIGYLLLPLLVGFTFGSFGAHGKESRQIFAREAPAVTDGQFWTALFTT